MQRDGTMRTTREAATVVAISKAFDTAGGDVAAAAILLGIQRSWLYVLINRSAALQDALKRVRRRRGDDRIPRD